MEASVNGRASREDAWPFTNRVLPWMLAAETLPSITIPWRAFALGDHAYALVSNPHADTLYLTRFTAPEFRKLTVAKLTVDDIAKDISVSDEDLHAAYDARAAEFQTPERRTVDQVLVQDEAAARAGLREGDVVLFPERGTTR